MEWRVRRRTAILTLRSCRWRSACVSDTHDSSGCTSARTRRILRSLFIFIFNDYFYRCDIDYLTKFQIKSHFGIFHPTPHFWPTIIRNAPWSTVVSSKKEMNALDRRQVEIGELALTVQHLVDVKLEHVVGRKPPEVSWALAFSVLADIRNEVVVFVLEQASQVLRSEDVAMSWIMWRFKIRIVLYVAFDFWNIAT